MNNQVKVVIYRFHKYRNVPGISQSEIKWNPFITTSVYATPRL